MHISSEIALRWMTQNPHNDEWTLVQVMASFHGQGALAVNDANQIFNRLWNFLSFNNRKQTQIDNDQYWVTSTCVLRLQIMAIP